MGKVSFMQLNKAEIRAWCLLDHYQGQVVTQAHLYAFISDLDSKEPLTKKQKTAARGRMGNIVCQLRKLGLKIVTIRGCGYVLEKEEE